MRLALDYRKQKKPAQFLQLFLVNRILPFFRVFPRIGNPVGFRCPLSKVDELAPFRAKRTIWVACVPNHDLATLGTVDHRLLHAANPSTPIINRTARSLPQSVLLRLTVLPLSLVLTG